MVWRTFGPDEERAVSRLIGGRPNLVTTPNPPGRLCIETDSLTRARKQPGRLRIVTLARIAPIKNLQGALAIMRGVEGEVSFDIYGPVDDGDYWNACQQTIASLPRNVTVPHLGALPRERVSQTLADYDLFFLTSESESYGYAILEALAAGVPVLVSDRTCWLDLENDGVGCDIPLTSPERFRDAIRRCAAMSEDDHRVLRERARQRARAEVELRWMRARYRRLFDLALRGATDASVAGHGK